MTAYTKLYIINNDGCLLEVGINLSGPQEDIVTMLDEKIASSSPLVDYPAGNGVLSTTVSSYIINTSLAGVEQYCVCYSLNGNSNFIENYVTETIKTQYCTIIDDARKSGISTVKDYVKFGIERIDFHLTSGISSTLLY